MPKKTKIREIRENAIAAIKALMAKYHLETVNACDINATSSPLAKEDPYESDLTFTLDRVALHDGSLEFDASSCFENSTWNEDSISTDALVDIQEWMEENEDEFERLADDGKRKIWVRLGGWVVADEETATAIEAGDEDALLKAIRENGFRPDGESYVPDAEAEFEINPDELHLVCMDKNQ